MFFTQPKTVRCPFGGKGGWRGIGWFSVVKWLVCHFGHTCQVCDAAPCACAASSRHGGFSDRRWVCLITAFCARVQPPSTCFDGIVAIKLPKNRLPVAHVYAEACLSARVTAKPGIFPSSVLVQRGGGG